MGSSSISAGRADYCRPRRRYSSGFRHLRLPGSNSAFAVKLVMAIIGASRFAGKNSSIANAISTPASAATPNRGWANAIPGTGDNQVRQQPGIIESADEWRRPIRVIIPAPEAQRRSRAAGVTPRAMSPRDRPVNHSSNNDDFYPDNLPRLTVPSVARPITPASANNPEAHDNARL